MTIMTSSIKARFAARIARDTIRHYASICNEDDQATTAKQAIHALDSFLDAPQPAGSSQKPVYAFRRRGLDEFCTCSKERFDELSDKPTRFETTIFYTSPEPGPEPLHGEDFSPRGLLRDVHDPVRQHTPDTRPTAELSKVCPYCNFNGQNNCANVAERILRNGGTPGDGHCSNYKVYGKRAHIGTSVSIRGPIRDVFLKHGFSIKEGQTDLEDYVYDAVYALLAEQPTETAPDPSHPLFVEGFKQGRAAGRRRNYLVRADERDWRTPTSYRDRFAEAVELLCGEKPPQHTLDDWIANTSEDLQSFAASHGPSWAQGIVLLDAAHVLAATPVEGVQHLDPEPTEG